MQKNIITLRTMGTFMPGNMFINTKKYNSIHRRIKMIRTIITTLIVFFCAQPALAQYTWKADRSHTAIQFKVQHMMLSNVTGNFNEFEITVVTEKPDDFENADVSVVISAGSINTNNERRDNHLRSDDFLNAEQFPELTFKSTSLKKASGSKYKLSGNLTIRDVTKPVELDLELYGIVQGTQGKRTIAGFRVDGSIDRFDFNVKFNRVLETGGFVVGKDIRFDMDVQMVRQD